MPSSGARSGTTPNRPNPAGDGRIMQKRALVCGCTIPGEQEPVALMGGVRWFVCEHGVQREKKKGGR